jgi:tRNA U34 5-methylaminomethyl-2-thiouridine-forming methyltransferase MnmC
MERKIILTKDGSHSISVPELNVTYHSIHGAIQESLYVFIEAGLKYFSPTLRIKIFEMGFGTGLNALLTLMQAEQSVQPVHYTAVELFPLNNEEVNSLNYCSILNQPSYQPLFEKIHQSEWEKDIAITSHFTLHKSNTSLVNFSTHQPFNLLYYDAFAPAAQPELWTREIFEKLYTMMSPPGILVTYCSKGDVRRAMQSAGFVIEKIPGPQGKREMIRARK